MGQPRDPATTPADHEGGERMPPETAPTPAGEQDPRLTPRRDERGAAPSGVEQVDGPPGRSAEEP